VEDQDMYVYGEKNYTDCGEEITLPARNGLQDVLLVRIEDSGDTYYIWTDASDANRIPPGGIFVSMDGGIPVTKLRFSSDFMSRTALQ